MRERGGGKEGREERKKGRERGKEGNVCGISGADCSSSKVRTAPWEKCCS